MTQERRRLDRELLEGLRGDSEDSGEGEDDDGDGDGDDNKLIEDSGHDYL